MKETLTAKEWLMDDLKLSRIKSIDTLNNPIPTMERYASYRTKELENKIKEFRDNMFSVYLQDSDIENIEKEYDKHFNIK